MFIDAANYSEQNTPANKTVAAAGGQVEVTDKALNQGRGLSQYGRVTTPYPLWDGTDRVLRGLPPLRSHAQRRRDPLRQPDRRRTGSGWKTTTMSRAERAADAVQDNAPAAYAIYMFDPAKQTWLTWPRRRRASCTPTRSRCRRAPSRTPPSPTSVDAALAARAWALIEVRSVYDTDGLDRMGEADDRRRRPARRLRQRHRADRAAERRPTRAPRWPTCARMKDPADPAYHCSPVRFVRATRAVAPPAGIDRHARGDRRDRLRAAADPGLRADRARRLVQAAACRPTRRWRWPSSTPRAAASRRT